MKNGDIVRPFMISGDGLKTYRDLYIYVIVDDNRYKGTHALITNGKENVLCSKNQLEKFNFPKVYEEYVYTSNIRITKLHA
jgi:predicted Rossmann fold nucleotide-binding protein DprA/Smf involved in DNA uptake